MQTNQDQSEAPRITLEEPPSFSLFKLQTLKALMRKPSCTPVQTRLPNKRLCLANQSISRQKLEQFQQVCGYGISDKLPISFLHLAAFDLQSALLTDEAMPLPLLGMVHLENSITRFKEVSVSDRFDIEVFLTSATAHRLGVTFDACCEITVDNTLVWSETSKTLCRLPKHLLSKAFSGESSGQNRPLSKPSRPCSEQATVWTVPDNTGRRYGSASGDRNPIHLWPLTAKLFGFKRHIAHGMWTLARAASEFEDRFEGKAVRYDAEFIKPVFLPSRVHYYQAHSEHNSINQPTHGIQVWNTNASRLHMNATVREL